MAIEINNISPSDYWGYTMTPTQKSDEPLNFRHGPRKFLTLPLLFMLVGLGISPQKAWAYTFASGTIIYVDMSSISTENFTANIFVDHGLKYTAETISGTATFKDNNNNGEFYNCNKPVVKITFNQDASCDAGKILFKCSANSWKEVKNVFPGTDQNKMTVTVTNDASSIVWSTYGGGGGGGSCTNCGTVNK